MKIDVMNWLRTAATIAMLAGVWCEPACAGLMGQYLFEEGSGTSALDTSGNGRDGANTNGPTYVTGLYQGSVFALQTNSNGSGQPNQAAAQSVVLPANTDFVRNAPGATLLGWVRLDGGTSNRTVIGINNGGSGEGGARATLQVVDSSGNAQLRALGRKNDDGGSSNANSGTNYLTIGKTHFVAGVFDYLGGGIRVYLDGQQVGSSTIAAWNTNSADSANKFAELGSVPSPGASNQEFWPGALDGLRIYDSALSGAEILGIYNTEVIPEPAALLLVACGMVGMLVAPRSGRRK